eukprot:gene5423-8274_t
MEVFVNPGVVGFRDDIDGIRHQYLFLRQHRYAVGDGVQRVEVVGDQEHAQAQRIAQGQDQLIEGGGADRVEAGGGFVEKQDVRVQRQGTGQGRALDHAAGE